MKKVLEYIKNNWQKTIHNPEDMKGEFRVPCPYMVPCISNAFLDMYYWDSYFINLGLMADGLTSQVENNLDNISYFINTLGYMPNANTLTDRSQPPFFTRAVFDYYTYTNNVGVISKYIDTILKEYEFWQTQRKAPFGLNNYADNCDKENLLVYYNCLSDRVMEKRETDEEKIAVAHDTIAIAESGLDFNMRFRTTDSKVDISSFIQLDLNCILYDVEVKISKMLKIIGKIDKSKQFEKYAAARKELINKYLFDKQSNIYSDYNIKTEKFSSVLSVISLYPFAFGVSNDKTSALKVLKRLEYEYGVSVCEKREDNDIYFQWDYPCEWPAATCLVYMALKNLGLKQDANRIMQKYMQVVDDNFTLTGKLWEKYDATTGKIAVTNEYETPEMMGWTAGVYTYFCAEMEKEA